MTSDEIREMYRRVALYEVFQAGLAMSRKKWNHPTSLYAEFLDWFDTKPVEYRELLLGSGDDLSRGAA